MGGSPNQQIVHQGAWISERLDVGMRSSRTSVFEWDFEAGELRHDLRFHAWQGVPGLLRGDVSSICSVLSEPRDVEHLKESIERLQTTDRFFVEHRRPSVSEREEWVRACGTVTERDSRGRPRRLCGTVSDISEWKELDARARRAERIASLATLASGMSHEINNPLACLIANVLYLEEELRLAPPAVRDGWRTNSNETFDTLVQAVIEASLSAHRVRDIIAELRAYTSPSRSTTARCDLRTAVNGAVRFVEHQLTKCASVVVEVPPLPDVAVSEGDIVQVLASLLANAAQATGKHPNHVRVSAEQRDPRSVVVKVCDTGLGIARGVLPRIFDPFFTTRGVGEGRGLGLSVSLGIVRAAGGDIYVDTTEGRGTTMTVRLPVAIDDPVS
ncbi:MAG: ATP-binding protein [Anaeromyxobacteraceae bacterium]